MNVCPHCGLVDESPHGDQPVELDGRLLTISIVGFLLGYGALLGLFAGFVNQSPVMVLLFSAILSAMLYGLLRHVRQEQRELMAFLASDESERVIALEEQPLPSIPMW